MIDFNRLLARVTSGVERGVLSQREAAHYVGEHVARRVYCSSATLWTISGTPERRLLTRVGGFDAVAGRPLADPMVLVDTHSSGWYDALRERRVFESRDVLHDARLPVFHAAAVGTRPVRAMLQAALGANGDLNGFISCTQHDTPRAWTPRELALLNRMAVALTLRRCRTPMGETQAVPASDRVG